MVNEIGRAYGFFDCNNPLIEVHQEVRRLESNLPKGTCSNLVLTLMEMSKFRRTCNDLELLQAIDSVEYYPIFHSSARKLGEQAKPMKMKDLGYALLARVRGTNNDAGDALVFIMNGLYAKYGDEMMCTSRIVGKSPEGEYGFWGED